MKMQSILKLIVLALAFSCALTFDVTLEGRWKSWKQTHNKRYSDGEEHHRRAIWETNWKIVEEHNLQADLGLHTYWLEMNKFADMTIDEFTKVMNGYTMQGPYNNHRPVFTFDSKLAAVPDFVDWRDRGVVTGVKDQGQCGSCWAFSATGALESRFARKTGNLISISEQNLIDCSQKQGNMGCKGGTMNQAFEYIQVNNGTDTETSYPYEGKDLTCRFRKEDVGSTDTGFVNLKSKDELALQQAVASIAPISAAIDANHTSFQLYKSGIYNEPTCSETQLNHGILVIGYGTDSGVEYWLVKNSWGTNWGMGGYIRMSRNKSNQCGIATVASYPTV